MSKHNCKTTDNVREAMDIINGVKEAQRSKLQHDRLACFLYLLMRDHLPTGTVCNLITDIGEGETEYGKETDDVGKILETFVGTEFEFTNKHLEAMARDYANRIKDD